MVRRITLGRFAAIVAFLFVVAVVIAGEARAQDAGGDTWPDESAQVDAEYESADGERDSGLNSGQSRRRVRLLALGLAVALFVIGRTADAAPRSRADGRYLVP